MADEEVIIKTIDDIISIVDSFKFEPKDGVERGYQYAVDEIRQELDIYRMKYTGIEYNCGENNG